MASLRLLLGFDYGTRSIGVAVGQMVTGQARELCNLKAENGIPKWEEIEKLIKEWQPDAIFIARTQFEPRSRGRAGSAYA